MRKPIKRPHSQNAASEVRVKRNEDLSHLGMEILEGF